MSSTNNIVSAGTIDQTSFLVASGLILSESYDFFVIAYSDTGNIVPSHISENITAHLWDLGN